MVTERELQHYTFAEKHFVSGSIKSPDGWDRLRERKRRLIGAHLHNPTDTPPEAEPGQEWLWTVFETVKGHYHFPDFVVVGGRDENGRPTAQAVEVELSRKKPSEVQKVLSAYKREFANGGVYGSLVWLVRDEAVKRLVERCAAAPHVEFPSDRRAIKVVGRWNQ